jgi:predicted permease
VRTGIFRYLVAAQVAFSFIVLFLAGIFVQSFARLSRVDLGFDPNHLVVVSINAKDLRNANTKALAVWNQVRERVGELPKIESASYSTWSLFTNSTWSESVRVPGKPVEESADTWYLPVSPRFFETMRMRLIAGRDFTPREAVAELPTAAIINEAFRNLHFPGEDSIGKRFFRIGDGNKLIAQDIVGVVSNARYTDLKQPVPPTVYVPMGPFAGITLQVRTTADASTIANVLRTELPRIHAALTVTQVSTQSGLVQDTILRERLLAVLSGFFAVVAMLLAGVGLYGVLSYIVVQRTREIGIRVALGARPSSVARSLLTDIGLLAAVGIAAGAVSGIFAARWFTALLFEVKPSNVSSIALPLIVLSSACVVAAVIPALRATRVDPVIALRYE